MAACISLSRIFFVQIFQILHEFIEIWSLFKKAGFKSFRFLIYILLEILCIFKGGPIGSLKFSIIQNSAKLDKQK